MFILALTACVMNFITHERAYCLYPLDTIDRSQSLVLARNTEEAEDALEKYHDRGFRICHLADEKEFRFSDVRWVEDQWSWVLPLPDIGLNSRTLPTDPVRVSTWSLVTVPRERHWMHFHEIYKKKESRVYPLISGTVRLSEKIEGVFRVMYAHGEITLTSHKEE